MIMQIFFFFLKTEPVTAGADGTEYVRLLFTSSTGILCLAQKTRHTVYTVVQCTVYISVHLQSTYTPTVTSLVFINSAVKTGFPWFIMYIVYCIVYTV